MADFLKKWYPFLLFGAFAVGGIVFLFVTMKPKWGGDKATYVDGREELSLGGEHYRLINDVDAETFVGSGVSDVLKTERGEQAGSIVSGGFMTLGVLFKVKGDAEGNYLVDSVGRIYAKNAISETEKKRLSDPGNFPVHRVLGTDKSLESFVEIKPEDYEKIAAAAADVTASVRISEKSVAEDFDGRRKIFAFTEDGMWYRACGELFCYKDSVFVTTGFLTAKQTTDHKAVLTGTALPAELQEVFRPLFP